MADHISSGFDESLNEINTLVLAMGGMALSQFHAIMDSLDTADSTVLRDLISADAKIDEMEITLNEKAIQTIALWSPFAEDLRKVFVAIKMGQILERIGDYAANIGKRSILLSDMGKNSNLNAELNELGEMARAMLVDALDAYRHTDEEKALSVWNSDVHLDERHKAINRSVIGSMDKGDLSAESGSQYMFILKNIERIGDFSTGIAEQVYFLIHAKHIEASRPKA